jgi:hypothetical protein
MGQLRGHDHPILLPKSSTAAIGRASWRWSLASRSNIAVGEANAIGALAGVTCFNDVSSGIFSAR